MKLNSHSPVSRLISRARGVGLVVLAGLAVVGCGREDNSSDPTAARPEEAVAIRGRPIRTLASGSEVDAGGSARIAGPQPGPALGRESPGAETVVDGFLQVGFERLSGFEYRVYEYYAEGVAGRPLLKSDDAIPESVKALNERSVAVQGFVLPLRTRKGRVTEFLLLRDQGTCCFGPQAQINHFIRVNFPKGREFEQGLPYRASGRLRVGETYVQGYLTGIYQLEAESVQESR